MADEVTLTEDPLFIAFTRPALWLGLPIEAMMACVVALALVLIIGHNPIYAFAVGGALYGACRLIVRTDYNMFRVLSLFMQTKMGAANRLVWGGSSYSPLPVVGAKRKGFTNGGY